MKDGAGARATFLVGRVVILAMFGGVACAPPGAAAQPATGAQGARPVRAAPWPGWSAAGERVRSQAMECTWDVSMPVWTLRRDSSGTLVPERLTTIDEESPPPSEAVLSKLPENVRRPQPGRRWRTITSDTGSLVALNDGEFGGGLFFVHRDGAEGRRLDAHLPEPIRWIGKTASDTVAVAGLCHGEGCTRKTHVYHLVPTQADWELRLAATLNGCPQSIQDGATEPEVLIATCGELHSVSTSGVRLLSTWDKALHAGSWRGAAARDANGNAYVSFGRVIGEFRQGAPAEWFVPSACLQPGAAESADCKCTGKDASST